MTLEWRTHAHLLFVDFLNMFSPMADWLFKAEVESVAGRSLIMKLSFIQCWMILGNLYNYLHSTKMMITLGIIWCNSKTTHMIIIILKLSDKNITNYNSLSRSTIYLIVHDSGNLQRYLYKYLLYDFIGNSSISNTYIYL